MISTGMIGTARQGTCAEQRQQDAREDIASRGAAVRQDRLAGPRHVRRIRVVADHLQAK